MLVANVINTRRYVVNVINTRCYVVNVINTRCCYVDAQIGSDLCVLPTTVRSE